MLGEGWFRLFLVFKYKYMCATFIVLPALKKFTKKQRKNIFDID